MIPAGVEQLVGKLQQALLPVNPHNPDWFDWQTLPLNSFYMGMLRVREQLGEGKFKFVDVGSGIGTKLYLAHTLGFQAFGIEHNRDYIEVSRRLFPRFTVVECDALEYTSYDYFDVIYSYRLARSDELQEEVNNHIVHHMKEGAVFFASDTKDSMNTLMAVDGVQGVEM